MCDCATTVRDITDMVNEERRAKGKEILTIDAIRRYIKSECSYIQPVARIGRSYIWNRKQAERIVRVISKMNTRKRFSWSEFLVSFNAEAA